MQDMSHLWLLGSAIAGRLRPTRRAKLRLPRKPAFMWGREARTGPSGPRIAPSADCPDRRGLDTPGNRQLGAPALERFASSCGLATHNFPYTVTSIHGGHCRTPEPAPRCSAALWCPHHVVCKLWQVGRAGCTGPRVVHAAKYAPKGCARHCFWRATLLPAAAAAPAPPT